MKRTTPITISGQLFHLEEEGYDLLRAYLDSLHRHFGGQEGAQEIMSDIEARVAERLSEIQNLEGITSIPPGRVVELMDGIGRPEDLDDSTADGHPSRSRLRDRRLFRDLDHGVIAGVSSGLGSYLSRNPNLIRMAFLIATLFGGAGAVIYAVLWLVIPAARTSSDRLQMQGTPVTAPAIARLLTGASRVVPDSKQILPLVSAPLHLARRITRTMVDATRSFARSLLPFLRVGTGASLVGGASLVTFIVCFFATLLLLRRPTSYLDPDLTTFLGTIPFPALVITGALAVLVPSALVLIAGISLLRARNLMQPAIGFGLVGIGFVATLAAGVLGTQSVMEWQAYTLNHPLYQRVTVTLSPDDIHAVNVLDQYAYVRVVEGSLPMVTISGRRKEMDRLAYTLDAGALQMEFSPAAPCVLCDRDFVSVTVTTPVPDSVQVRRYAGR